MSIFRVIHPDGDQVVDADLLALGLADINERLEALAALLADMPSYKRGSFWHLNRVAERQELLRKPEALRDQARGERQN